MTHPHSIGADGKQEPHDFDGVCPVCGAAMVVTRVSCGQCGSALEGVFHLTGAHTGVQQDGQPAPVAIASLEAQINAQVAGQIAARFGRLARLDRTQLAFVEVFLQSRGVIKNVEDMLGISYPTVKSRLAGVLEAMGYSADDEPAAADVRQRRRQILAELANGRITPDEALSRLGDATGADGENAENNAATDDSDDA